MLRTHAEAFLSDLRYGLRSMARTPAFTAVALVMIALGTGANAAMFSMIDAVMLRTPFSDPDRIAIVRVGRRAAGDRSRLTCPIPEPRGIGAGVRGRCAFGSGQRPILRGLGEPRRMNVECFTAGMFRVLGVAPLAGRTFTADEDRAGGPGAVILSYEFWKREFGGAPARSDGASRSTASPATIVGIMPRGFLGPLSRNYKDGWMPLGPGLGSPSPAGCASGASVNVFARVASGSRSTAPRRRRRFPPGIAHIPEWNGKVGTRLMLDSL